MGNQLQTFLNWYRHPDRALLRREARWATNWFSKPSGLFCVFLWVALNVAEAVYPIRLGRLSYPSPYGLLQAIVLGIVGVHMFRTRTLVAFRKDRLVDLVTIPNAQERLWPALLCAPIFVVAALTIVDSISGVMCGFVPGLDNPNYSPSWIETPFTISMGHWLNPILLIAIRVAGILCRILFASALIASSAWMFAGSAGARASWVSIVLRGLLVLINVFLHLLHALVMVLAPTLGIVWMFRRAGDQGFFEFVYDPPSFAKHVLILLSVVLASTFQIYISLIALRSLDFIDGLRAAMEGEEYVPPLKPIVPGEWNRPLLPRGSQGWILVTLAIMIFSGAHMLLEGPPWRLTDHKLLTSGRSQHIAHASIVLDGEPMDWEGVEPVDLKTYRGKSWEPNAIGLQDVRIAQGLEVLYIRFGFGVGIPDRLERRGSLSAIDFNLHLSLWEGGRVHDVNVYSLAAQPSSSGWRIPQIEPIVGYSVVRLEARGWERLENGDWRRPSIVQQGNSLMLYSQATLPGERTMSAMLPQDKYMYIAVGEQSLEIKIPFSALDFTPNSEVKVQLLTR